MSRSKRDADAPGDPERDAGARADPDAGLPDEPWVRAALARHERSLLALATRVTGDRERARDVVQETFLRLCRTPRREVEDHLRAWLHTVCRNHALDVTRRERRMTDLADATADGHAATTAAPDERAERAEDAATVLGALDRLPGRQREALLLKFQNGLSYREIAEVMQTSAGNVGWLLHHGLKALRERLAGRLAPEHMDARIEGTAR